MKDVNPSSPARPRGPPVIPDFELIRLIGQGGYGDVWLARGMTGVYRAIKVVWRDRFPTAEPFDREFNGLKKFMAMSLHETGQLALLHAGHNEGAGFFYYVMELADDLATGTEINPASYAPLTLKELRARRGRLSAAECVNFGVALARALAGVHSHGLVHRDIKPSNVIVVGGVPKLADIGLVAEMSDTLTCVGTEGFVPPEGPGKPSADVFALGKLLYELTTGSDRGDFPRLPPELDKVSDRKLIFELNEIILRCCEPVAGQRYPDARSLLADLSALQAGQPVKRLVRRARGALLGVTAVAIFAAIFVWLWPRPREARTAPSGARDQLPIVASLPDPLSIGLEKSLVVLPFDSLGTEPETASFSDIIQADITATLSSLADLKVISRKTACTFKGKDVALPEIGRQLGVGVIIAGTVQRLGERYRIHIEVRRARDETIILPKTYEADVREPIAKLSEVSADVAKVLQARTSVGRRAQFMTQNPRAYTLFLKGSFNDYSIEMDRVSQDEKCIEFVEEALKIDPGFLPAAEQLSALHVDLSLLSTDLAVRARHEAEARRWAEKCSQMMPGGGGDGALSYYLLHVEKDLPRALMLADKVLNAWPNDPGAHCIKGLVLANMGKIAESLPWTRRCIALEPVVLMPRAMLLVDLSCLRRPEEFNVAMDEYQTRPEAAKTTHATVANACYRMTGAIPKTLDKVMEFPGVLAHEDWLWRGRRFHEALVLIEGKLGRESLDPVAKFRLLCRRCDVLRRLNRPREADQAALQALTLAEKLREDPESDTSQRDHRLARALVAAGRVDEGIMAGRRYVEAMRVPNQQAVRWQREAELARLYAQANRPKECLTLIASLLRVPSGLTVPMLRVDPDWDNLREHPQFKALLTDPKNSAPL